MGTVIGLTSCRQGAGKTTLAANLAFELAAIGARVCLVDLDYTAPMLHHYFAIPTNQASVAAGLRLQQQGRLNLAGIQKIATRLVAKGAELDFLSGFALDGQLHNFGAETLVAFVGALSSFYSHVVLDLPAACINGDQKALPMLTQLELLVIGTDPLALFQLQTHLQHCSNQKYELVANRFVAEVYAAVPQISAAKAIAAVTSLPIVGFIPQDTAVAEAAGRSLPLRQLAKKSKAQAALSELARRYL